MEQSKFYRQRPAEAFVQTNDDERNQGLKFPKKLQIVRPRHNKAVLFKFDQFKYLKHKELGYLEQSVEIGQLKDPEQYVDSDYLLCHFRHNEEQNVSIWEHINANVSPELYHVYQEWESN